MSGRRAAFWTPVVIVALAGCGGGSEGGAQPPPSAAEEDSAVTDLPEECVEEIRSFLVGIEPIAEGIDFATASEADLEALASAGDDFDPDVCPDVSTDEAREAWLAIAEESAPGAIPYIEFTYAD